MFVRCLVCGECACADSMVVDGCQYGVGVRYVNGFLIFETNKNNNNNKKKSIWLTKHHNLIVRQYANSMRRFTMRPIHGVCLLTLLFHGHTNDILLRTTHTNCMCSFFDFCRRNVISFLFFAYSEELIRCFLQPLNSSWITLPRQNRSCHHFT